ncbi:hypothetical protein P3T97_04240 [Mammaliicoccus sciuri]|uniref:hypothetical protein n=1 Tax=Mammaliicoccus sciuri TaxID=1296 RepID=UPI002B262A9F|nr:hypothetical protein [Mammaliicoccus sciuri]WQJ66631.1 hypothetical protein P3T97_04240 [Mammaliicoccus sciuri]
MTNEAKFVLLQLYSIYLDRIEDGDSKRSAAYFGSDEESFNSYFLGFNFEDYIDSVFELKSKNLLIVGPGDDGFAEMALSREGIAFSESESKKNYKVLLDLIKDLKKLIF